MKLQAGDTVQLKSGGPFLTVGKIEGDEARCHWIDSDRKTAHKETFPVVCLKKVDLEDDG